MSTRAYCDCNRLTVLAVRVFQFLMRCASSKITRSGDQPAIKLAHAVLKAVLADHLAVPTRALDATVFPDSAAAKPLQGLLRA